MADDSFKEFVLDQLSALPDVRAKAMFGAHGIYSGDKFFAILDEGRLFFKTDAVVAGGIHSARHGTVHLRNERQSDDDGVSRSAAGHFGTATGTRDLGAAGHRHRRRQTQKPPDNGNSRPVDRINTGSAIKS